MPDYSAVVVGASGGIGSALADNLERRGAHARVRRLSRSETGFDITDEASIAAAVASWDGPPPNLVVVATGILHDGHQPERTYRALTLQHLTRDYQVNAAGPALVAKHVLPLMPRDDRAVFTAVSARVGSIGDNRLGGWHAYRASKAALNMILKNLAIEMARTHPQMIVAGLHPGTVDTRLSGPFQKHVAADRLFTPAASAERLIAVLDRLTPADSGGVFGWDGAQIPA